MALQFNLFFRLLGIRKPGQLMSPPLPKLERLDFPRSSLFHYVGEGLLDDGPKADEYVFRNITRPILLANVTTISDNKGAPRRLGIPVEPLIRSYHLRNRRYRKLHSLETIPKDPMTMVIVNYSFIPRLYRYMRSIYSEYYRWHNQQASLWKTMDELATTSRRYQFVISKLPQRLPSISELKLATREMNQRSVKTFNEHESLFILELWKWLGETRSSSLLARVNPANYDKINIIFLESGRFILLNLGTLESWRAATKEELEASPLANEKGFAPLQLQKRFLRLMISLFNARTALNLDENLEGEGNNEDEVSGPKPTLSLVDTQKTGSTEVSSKSVQENEDETEGEEEQSNEASDDEVIEENFEEDFEIDKDLEALEKIAQQSSNVDFNSVNTDPALDFDDEDDAFSQPDAEAIELEKELSSMIAPPTKLLEDAFMKFCDAKASDGLMSANEYRRYQALSKSYKTIVSPDGKSTLDKFIQISKEDLKIPDKTDIVDNKLVFDKTMLKSSLLEFDAQYIKNVLSKDVASMVMNVQRAGIAVTDYEVNRVESILGDIDEYTIKINPVEGASSTIRFKLPVVNEDGIFTVGGSKYNLRKQRLDLPIRKVAPDKVGLTSYYGKTFVSRSSKKVNDYGQWIRDSITELNLNRESSTVKELYHAQEFDNTFMCPRIYSILATQFKSLTLIPVGYPRVVGLRRFELNFNHEKRVELYGQRNIDLYEKEGSIIIGQSERNGLLIVDAQSAFYFAQGVSLDDTTTKTPNTLIAMGSIEELLGLDLNKAPIDYAELKVLGRQIPIGVILGYEMGLEKLLKLLKLTPRRVPVGTRVNLIPNEYALVFNDETLVFSRDETYASIIMAGFNSYHRALREYNVDEFNEKAVYLNLIESAGLSNRYLKEIESLYQLFIDPITRDLLVEMKEPTNFRGLLLRSCELLKYDQHPDEMDGKYMRIRGYERFAGIVYTELTKAIRAHSGRPGKAKLPIDLNPYQIWIAVTTDRSKVQISEINPIEDLKNQEAVTYVGTGGRTPRTMVKRNRIYHEHDKGVISEATVDSSDTGVNVYMPANPTFTSLRGLTRPYNPNKDGLTSLVSTSALIAPSGTKDDMRRLGFSSIQNKHFVDCDGYTQPMIRTGYEEVIPQRTSDLFAYAAKDDGKVISVNDTGIIVEYRDGTQKGIELGRRFGAAAGLTIPHEVKTELKKDQNFKKGDIISYNPGFFEKDNLDPSKLILKMSRLATTVLMENPITLEDSSAISQKLANELTAGMTKVRDIALTFTQNVYRLVKVGAEVDVNDILCIIEDPVGETQAILDEKSVETLRALSSQTPLAKYKGVVERVEVFYHGEKEDMSPTLVEIASESDKLLLRRNKSSGKGNYDGSVDDSFRVDNNPLMMDNLVIRIYISHRAPIAPGDKSVFANQLKTVVGEVFNEEVKTESGIEIDAIFGKLSVDNRIVGSVDEMGTTNVLLELLAARAINSYNH